MSQEKYDQRTEKSIGSLQPDFAPRARQWLAECRKRGMNPLVHFGARSVEEQRKLHEKYLAGGPRAVAPERSYHCYGRAFDWVNIIDPNAGDDGLAWDDDDAYAKGVAIGALFQIVGIGAGDNDHLQDGNFPTYAQLPATELGHFPEMIA
jgi:hypothetical protein